MPPIPQLSRAPQILTICATGHFHLLEALLTRLFGLHAEPVVPLLDTIGLKLDRGFGVKHSEHSRRASLANCIQAIMAARSIHIPLALDQASLKAIIVPHCITKIPFPFPYTRPTLYADWLCWRCECCSEAGEVCAMVCIYSSA